MGNIKRKIINIVRFVKFYDIYRKDKKQKIYFDRQLTVHKLGVEKDEFVLLSSTGIGDLYLKLILIQGLKESLKTNKISVGFIKEKHLGVIDLFKYHIYKIYHLTPNDMNILSEGSHKPELGSVSHPYFVLNTFHSIGFNNFTFIDLIKLQFNLPLEFNNYILPVIKKEIETETIKKLNNLGIEKDKAILLSPNAVTFKPIIFEFWTEVLIELLNIGYKVLVLDNSDNYKKLENDNIITIDFPLEESLTICNYCGNFIGLRSGFCDLISSSISKKVILYPDLNDEKTYYDSINGFSLSNLGITDTNTLLEIVYKKYNQEELIDKIISFILK